MLRRAVIAFLIGTVPVVAAAAEGPLEPLPASFVGTLPAASGPGVAWQLDLLADESFQLRRTYLGREPKKLFDSIGRWVVGTDGRSLLLAGRGDESVAFAIESAERLRLLDRDAQPIESLLPYHLERAAVPLLEPELGLLGMYRYMADAAIFDECLTGRRLPVAFVADNLPLERAYLELQRTSDLGPGVPVLAELRGPIAQLPSMEGPGLVPTLEPLRFIALHQEATCPAPFAPAEFGGTEWQLNSLGDHAIEIEEGQRRPYLVFMPDDLRVSGFGGCNRLLGGMAMHGDQLRFSRTASTLMACPAGSELERALLKALEATDRYRVLGRQLDLLAADGTALARFAAAAAVD